LSQAEQGSRELWGYAKSGVREAENEDGALILDDTIEEKLYTDENEIVCWHHCHTKGRHVKGMNLLTSLVRYEDIAFPIGYEIVRKDLKVCKDVKAGSIGVIFSRGELTEIGSKTGSVSSLN